MYNIYSMKPSFLSHDTIAALATPRGEGPIGVVRLSGPDSIRMASSYITLAKGENLMDMPAWRAALGVLKKDGRRLDQVIVTVFRSPHSFTGEDMVEISCHGGIAVVRQILDLFFKAGARPAEPGEFSQRAYLNRKLDLLQAEAVADLISARTGQSSRVALSNLEGRLSSEVRDIRDNLVAIMASLEVALDHTDDDAVGASLGLPEIGDRLGGILGKMDKLISSHDFGRHLKEGFRVAIVGKPNAGKSSLLNSILGQDRAIVSPHPGTTRDTIEESFDLLGVPGILVDTAGLRSHTLDPIEEIGMERTHAAIRQSDAVVVVLDGSSTLGADDARVAELAAEKKGVIALAKKDLPERADPSEVLSLSRGKPIVPVCALKNEGILELLQSIGAGFGENSASENGSAVVTSARHKRCLVRARAALAEARDLTLKGEPEECVAVEIRGALDDLAELTGEVATEDILKEVFSSFCIGK